MMAKNYFDLEIKRHTSNVLFFNVFGVWCDIIDTIFQTLCLCLISLIKNNSWFQNINVHNVTKDPNTLNHNNFERCERLFFKCHTMATMFTPSKHTSP